MHQKFGIMPSFRSAWLILACSGLILAVAACGDGRPRQVIGELNMFEDETLRSMYAAADERNATELLSYAEHSTAAYRRGFARLAGSMPDSSLLPAVAKLLSDPIPYVRLEAAWAIGQWRDTLALASLETAMRKATIPEVKAELLEAIGKCAHEHAMAFLIRHEPGTPIEEAGKMWGIYRASLRGLLQEKHLRVVVAHLRSREMDTRLAAAHILARQEQFGLHEYAEALQQAAASDPSAEVRHMALQALRHTDTADGFYTSVFQNDAEPSVRAAAIKALTAPAVAPGLELVVNALEDGNPLVAMEAALRLNEVGMYADASHLRGIALTSHVPEVQAAVLALFFQNAEQDAWLLYRRLWLSHGAPGKRRVLVRALAATEAAFDTLVHLLQAEPAIATASAAALVSGSIQYPSWRQPMREVVLRELAEGGDGVAAVFAEAIPEAPLSAIFKADTARIRTSVIRFPKPGQNEVREGLRKAYFRLRGEGYQASSTAHNHPIDWDEVVQIDRKAQVIFYIGGTPLLVQLLVEDAPGSVTSFVQLTRRNYYDGLTVHRIVPGFVSQGGCPVGDGYHSTDYSLRSEFSALRFGQGVVGLASSGPDTEGPQFFITHMSAPHLDGRYTVFGAVIQGLEAITEWTTGTRIDSVRMAI